jgi:hypothetical protein
MMMKDLLLVRLPKVPDVDQEFFGIGYYSDSGFIFCLLTEDIVNTKPLRKLPFPKNTGYDSSNDFEILGTIKNLKRDESQRCKE